VITVIVCPVIGELGAPWLGVALAASGGAVALGVANGVVLELEHPPTVMTIANAIAASCRSLTLLLLLVTDEVNP
jgi:hypothetical protein